MTCTFVHLKLGCYHGIHPPNAFTNTPPSHNPTHMHTLGALFVIQNRLQRGFPRRSAGRSGSRGQVEARIAFPLGEPCVCYFSKRVRAHHAPASSRTCCFPGPCLSGYLNGAGPEPGVLEYRPQEKPKRKPKSKEKNGLFSGLYLACGRLRAWYCDGFQCISIRSNDLIHCDPSRHSGFTSIWFPRRKITAHHRRESDGKPRISPRRTWEGPEREAKR